MRPVAIAIGVPVSRFLPVTHVQAYQPKAATSLSDVAKLVSYRPSAVSYILYQQPAASNYTTFQIPKRNGGYRTIKAPVKTLKVLQRKLSDLLQNCVEEINTDKKRKDRMAHGFKRNRSIITTLDSTAGAGGSSTSIWRISSRRSTSAGSAVFFSRTGTSSYTRTSRR